MERDKIREHGLRKQKRKSYNRNCYIMLITMILWSIKNNLEINVLFWFHMRSFVMYYNSAEGKLKRDQTTNIQKRKLYNRNCSIMFRTMMHSNIKNQ